MELKGIIPVIPAAFTEDGERIDFDSLAKLVEVAVEEGANGVALFGIATEFYKLSDEERKNMIKAVISAADKQIPVIVSVTRNSTVLAVRDALEAQQLGADGIMIFSPHFYVPSTEKLLYHIKAVADAVTLPIIVQYTPQAGGGTMKAEDLVKLQGEMKNRLYLKAEPIPSGPMISRITELSGGKVGVFSGNAGFHMLDSLMRGACGIMPGCALLKTYVTIYQLAKAGNMEKAWEYYQKIMPFFQLINQTGEMFVAFEKGILKERGILKSAHCRKPNFEYDALYWEEAMRLYDAIKASMDVGRTYD